MLHKWRVDLIEKDNWAILTIWECNAEDWLHAIEQAENAYPECEVLNAVRIDD